MRSERAEGRAYSRAICGWQEGIQPVLHCLPRLLRAGKQSRMKALLTLLIIGGLTPLPVMAANPLSPAETTACRSLQHCLDIIETHPPDSFDYDVLAVDFKRFGAKGRKALIRKVKKSNRSAANAADLLAISGDAAVLALLKDHHAKTRPTPSLLITRTIVALQTRLDSPSDSASAPLPARMLKQVVGAPQICAYGTAIPFESRRREMPFFEYDMATPDGFGAYRPSATYQSPLPLAARGWLRTARPVPGGWLAGYPDGLIQYDSRTGAPALRLKGNILSVQAMRDDVLTANSWGFMLNTRNQTFIVEVQPNSVRQVTALPGPLRELRRADDGSIYASSSDGRSVTLRPDGSTVAGCESAHP